MLQLSKTRLEASRQFPVASTFAITAEGMALVLANDNGVAAVKPSTAGTSDAFAGFSTSHTMVPSSALYYGSILAVGTVLTLPNTPISGQIALYDGAQILTAGNPATTANEYSISGNVVTLHAGQSAKTITVRLRYALTVEQAVQLYGEGMPGDLAAADLYDRVGSITKGVVYTDQYDVTGVWVAAAAVKSGANGQVVPAAGTGTTIPNCYVHEVPSSSNGGFLGLILL